MRRVRLNPSVSWKNYVNKYVLFQQEWERGDANVVGFTGPGGTLSLLQDDQWKTVT